MNYDTVICEKCGAEMKPINEDKPIGMECPDCGWGWATTYIEPINLDESDYHVILTASGNSITVIKTVSEVANCNYIEAKKMINNAPVEVFHGQAVEVKAIKEKLEAASIDFKIEPEFPY
jgi:large subunit ribosomal protein L7/L12